MSTKQSEIETLVRQVVKRTLGSTRGASSGGASRTMILGEQEVRQMPTNSTQEIAPGALITPLARQAAQERRITLVESETRDALVRTPALSAASNGRSVVALGADHGGYALKEQLKVTLTKSGYETIDCGAHSQEAVDYPDYAYAVARLVANGQAWRGILIDGAGIGSCMAANKVPGARAAMCYDQATAVNSREHNNANVLTLGAGLIGPNLAQQIAMTWLETAFVGGRHARRVAKIDAIEGRFSS